MKGIRSIIGGVTKGKPLPENVKVNEIAGIYDPLMFSLKRKRALEAQRDAHKGSLAESIVKQENEKERVFGVRMSHRIPFYRENEMKRWDVLAHILRSIGQEQ